MRMFGRIFLITLWVVGVLGVAIFPAYGATFDVTNCNDSGAGSLRQAVLDANGAGGADDITFSIVCNPITLTTGEITISDSVNINGNGSTISGNNASRIFSVTGTINVTIDNLTFTNGSSAGDGTIYNDGANLTINNSTFTNNITSLFGGAVASAGTLTINNSTFTNNTASFFGGAVFSVGTLTISDSTFTGNTSTNAIGGAVVSDGPLTISNSTFTNNTALFAGGAVFSFDPLTISNSTFNSNTVVNGNGGAVASAGTSTITDSIFTDNVATTGGAIYLDSTTLNSQNTHYENNDCVGTIIDGGGNTVIAAPGCPGSAPMALDVSPLTCSGDSAVFEILAGDGDFSITGMGAGLPISPAAAGLYGLVGPDTWMNITITELRGDRESVNIGGIICPEAVIIAPTTPPAPSATLLGCALDTTDGLEIANAPDNTYCRVLMNNGAVVNYAGAVPQNLIDLGVIYAVDVYRLQGGQSIVEFPNYARVCLAGQGRLFYLDARTSPRVQVELTTETEGNLTCGWIPAAGTLVLTK